VEEIRTKEVAEAVINLIRKKAPYIRNAFITKKFDVHEKERNQIVTSVDVEIEIYMREELSKIIKCCFIGEETSSNKYNFEDYAWVVDPIDGTTNFVHGIPLFTVSVGLVRRGKPHLGVVYDVMGDVAYYGWEGGGAYINGEHILPSSNNELRRAVIASGFPLSNMSKYDMYESIFKELAGKIRGIRRTGSATLDIVWTAEGKFDALIEYGLQVWDVAAGIIIALESGCVVSDFYGNIGKWNGDTLIVCSPHIYEYIMEVVGRVVKNHEGAS